MLLDHLTRGRVIFGAGPGALPSDAYMMGIDPVDQRRMMQESLEAILALFRAAPDEPISGRPTGSRCATRSCRSGPTPSRTPRSPSPQWCRRRGPAWPGARRVAAVAVDVGARGLRRHRRPGTWSRSRPQKSGRDEPDRADWRVLASCTWPRPGSRRSRTAPTGCGTSPTTSARRASCRCPTPSKATQSPREFVEEYAGPGNCCIGTPDDAIAYIEDLLEQSGGFGTFLLLGHDWAVAEATYHSYGLFAREVIPHFKGQLAAPRASHDWAKGKRDQLFGRAGEAIVKAINEHTDELKLREGAVMRAAVLRGGRMVLRDDVAEPVPGSGQVLVGVKACGICGSDLHFAKHGDQMLEADGAR